jgi:hypothetical protein
MIQQSMKMAQASIGKACRQDAMSVNGNKATQNAECKLGNSIMRTTSVITLQRSALTTMMCERWRSISLHRLKQVLSSAYSRSQETEDVYSMAFMKKKSYSHQGRIIRAAEIGQGLG